MRKNIADRLAGLWGKNTRERVLQLGYPLEAAPRLFLCVNKVCAAPISEAEELPTLARDFIRRSCS